MSDSRGADSPAACPGYAHGTSVPSRLRILGSFPRTVSGKVRKVESRQKYAEN